MQALVVQAAQAKAYRIIDFDNQMPALNNLPDLENPTCERIAVYIWDNIKPFLPLLVKVELHETPTSGVIYAG